MKSILLSLLIISNVCWGQHVVEDSSWLNSDSTFIYKHYTNGGIDSFPVTIYYGRDLSHEEPIFKGNEYELGDEGGNAKVVNNKLFNVHTASPEYYEWRKKKDTIPNSTMYTDGIPQHSPNTFHNITTHLKDTISKVDTIPKPKYKIKNGGGFIRSGKITDSGTIHFKKDTVQKSSAERLDSILKMMRDSGITTYAIGVTGKYGTGELSLDSSGIFSVQRQKVKYDTIPCTLLVTDQSEFDYTIAANVEAVKGYLVRDGWMALKYLDIKKVPLPKNIIVWNMKEEK